MLASDETEQFACDDGFMNASDMAAFWMSVHGVGDGLFGPNHFEGTVIFWWDGE